MDLTTFFPQNTLTSWNPRPTERYLGQKHLSGCWGIRDAEDRGRRETRRKALHLA